MSFRYHDNVRSPLVNYPLDGRLDDVSGNGRDLTVISGTARYTDVAPGLLGAWFDTATVLGLSAFDAALAITGDVTIEMIVEIESVTSYEMLFHGTANSETAANNFLFWAGCITSNFPQFKSESGSGVDATYTAPAIFMQRVPYHFALRRQSDVVTIFLNGESVGVSGTLTAPTDGSSGRLRIGGGTTSAGLLGGLASIVIIDSALSDTEIFDDATYTGFAQDSVAPFLSGQTPGDGDADVAVDASIVFTVDDVGTGVDPATAIVEVDFDDGMGFVTAYTGEAFDPAFGGTATTSTSLRGLDFSITHADFSVSRTISVRVTASDYAGNELVETYSFSTSVEAIVTAGFTFPLEFGAPTVGIGLAPGSAVTLAPSTFEDNGGHEASISVTSSYLPEGCYEVSVVLPTSSPKFSGFLRGESSALAGLAKTVDFVETAGVSVGRAWTPVAEPGTFSLMFRNVDTGDEVEFVEAITFVPHSYRSNTHSLVRVVAQNWVAGLSDPHDEEAQT